MQTPEAKAREDGARQWARHPTLQELEEIKKRVIAQIEGQNWTDEPLSDQDKNLISMAVSATTHILDERSKAKEDAAFAALIAAAREWAQHMDQWDKFKFNTEFGMVYVTVGRSDQWPDDFVDVGEMGLK